MTSPPSDDPQPRFQHPLIRPAADDAPCSSQHEREDEVRWLALLVRQGLQLVVAGIEKRYGLEDHRKNRAV